VRSLIGFVAVAEELNFRRAAGRLHLGQPGLSRLVSKLEQEVSVKLLDRSTTHVQLTPAGAVFLDHARAILASLEAAVHDAKETARVPSPASCRVRVGLSEWAERLASRVLHAFRRACPAVDIGVEHVPNGCPVDELCDGGDERFDVVFCRSAPDDERLEVAPLVDEPLVAALPAGHRLDDEAGQLDLSALADEPLVLFPRTFAPGAHDQIVNLCDRAGFQPHIAHETVPLSPMAAVVAAGSGIALVPASAAFRFDPAHVSCRRIDAPTPTMPLVLVRRRAGDSPLVDRLSEVAFGVVGPGAGSGGGAEHG
jgi:DNA-binding transcriptional LysR family regulator